MRSIFYLVVKLLVLLPCATSAQEKGKGGGTESPFRLQLGPAGITSLKRAGDLQDVEFLREGASLGNVQVRFRTKTDPWTEAATAALAQKRQEIEKGNSLFAVKYELGSGLILFERFTPEGGTLLWTLRFRNDGDQPIEMGDLALPLLMRTDYPHGFDKIEVKQEIFTRRLLKHAFISGHGSFLFWLPVGGEGPHLVLTPVGGTHLEYFTETHSNYAHGGGKYTVFVHSAASGAGERRGTWRQEHTSRTLAPGEETTCRFALRWAAHYQGIRDILHEQGGFDIRVVPGMVVPVDLFALCALRTRSKIERVAAEFPGQTRIELIGHRQNDTEIYRVKFSRLGENRLTVNSSDGRVVHLEFFVTQPLELLIKKRARFIAGKQQHRDPSKWYDGLFSLWDARMPEGRNLLGPDNRGGQHPYAVSGSDDPSNSKCLYLSEKNAVFPDPKEIEALEYFLERFVWGKHQRTDRETPYPYGIYGADSWHINRFAKRDLLEGAVSRPGGPSQCRMWRTFDYTTYFALYYNLYRIARQNPSLVNYLDAGGYLERAFGTARAFFEVPYNIRMEGGWSFSGWTDWAYTIGNFHEKYLLNIIDALEAEGQQAKADELRRHWERKVKYFLYDDPYPFISEMPVDSTAYESSYAIARYALKQGLSPDEKLWRDKNSGKWYSHPKIDPQVHEEFLRRQLLANLACRGWLEASYYHYGSDFRGCGSSFYTLSYMSQMGGWAILDQAIEFEKDPAELLRLGYASMLSSWALLNAGTPQSNYGFWYPGEQHDGAVGWGFTPQKAADEWNPAVKGNPRGAWPVDGEIDHGLTSYVETAATIVADDPLFGSFAYGGLLERKGDTIRVVPRDGVRRRLFVVRGKDRVRIQLESCGFQENEAVVYGDDFGEISFQVERRATGKDVTWLNLLGLPQGRYSLAIDGRRIQTGESVKGRKMEFRLPLPAGTRPARVEIKRRNAPAR